MAATQYITVVSSEDRLDGIQPPGRDRARFRRVREKTLYVIAA
jgi:hypothetical protein